MCMYIMYIVKSLKESQLIHQLQLYSIDEDCISFHYYGRILKEKIICKLFLYEACLKKKRKQKMWTIYVIYVASVLITYLCH